MQQLPSWTNLPLAEQIAQMLVVRTSGYLFNHQRPYPIWEASNQQLLSWLSKLNLGGVILLGGSAAEVAKKTEILQNWAKTPLLIAADIEEGVGQRFSGASWFPPPLALGKIAEESPEKAEKYAEAMGEITAQEALSIGINWLLAPVVDVNNNPLNPVINVRAFAETPKLVGKLATSFIKGAQRSPVLTTAKHFPGHGDTATDSHLELPVLKHTNQRLKNVELPPFQEAIAAGVDSVMIAHLLIPEWDPKYPATLSQTIITEQLRNNLGFSGLVVTDSLIMGGITNYAPLETIAVKAIAAGADILLMPEDPHIVINAVLKAIDRGELSRDRIEEANARIWEAKAKITMIDSQPVNFLSQLSTSQGKKTIEEILQKSLVSGGKLPLNHGSISRDTNLIILDNVLNNNIVSFHNPAVTIPQNQGYQLQVVDEKTLPLIIYQNKSYLLQIFVRGNPFRGSAGFSSLTQNIFQQLLKNHSIRGVVIYGSPYILEWFQPQLPLDIPWVFSYGQMPQAQSIALSHLFLDMKG